MANSLAEVASQLRSAQSAAGGAAAAAQASAVASSAVGVLQSGGERARGAFRAMAGAAQGRAGLLPSEPVPPDGTRCEGCGAAFGAFRRRQTCSSCDQFLCAACFGSSVAAWSGISCLCATMCPRCRDMGVRGGEFNACRPKMESGTSVTIGIPHKAGFFGGGGVCGPRKLTVWLNLAVSAGELRWGTLEQRNGRPAEEGRILVSEVVAVRDTGCVLELSLKGQTTPTTLEFSDPASARKMSVEHGAKGASTERSSWCRYIELAVEILTPESERAELDAARASHRHGEIEERRLLNEDRRKKLSENLGMRFTAEAMMARGPGS